ncbi:hypothetical protein [Siccirubricoccus sp. G192]|uniref:hypothetical protein n=1 Tax=Siccirubricoccus sp. G192 TaxID=2849651 RepID=UPI001C2BD87B|nr:hypothetical protein [Siccirubricoccus sp. G192]MBV1800498.1 hypothetical protein [Siccirubricoccus sp. G192]
MGSELQYLTLRRLPAEDHVLVPERAGFGQVVAPHLGLQGLHDDAEQAIAQANGLTLTDLSGRPRLQDDQLFAPCPVLKTEVFRLENADWRLLRAPATGVLPQRAGSVDALGDLAADIVLLSTPLAARHHGWLRTVLGKLTVPVQILASGTSARGCLEAARRIARGAPHYLDRLDPVALVVLRLGEPVFEDLIPAGAIVPGNREYVSPPIRNMVWGRGMATAQFFLRKGQHEIRRWVTPEVPAPDGEEHLLIQLKQRPAQGWAALTISSASWDYLARNPVRLDWMTLERESRSGDEILASLRQPRPVVPQRVHQPAGMLAWEGMPGREGLGDLLARFDVGRPGDISELADTIRWSPRAQDGSRLRAIGSDGDLPPALDHVALVNLQRAAEALSKYLMEKVARQRGLANNGPLLALTWMYERCPAEVVREIVGAVRCVLENRRHVFLEPVASTTVVMHGAGRVVREPGDLIELIPRVLDWLADASSLNNGLGLLAGIMSRPAATSRILSQLDMDHLAAGLMGILRRLTRQRISGSRLKYALIAMVGLLRVREHDPWALVADRSRWATSFVEILRQETGYLRGAQASRTIESIAEVIMMLEGVGGRPDIFSVLETIEE